MLVTHEREKLVNAIVYFAQRANHVGKVKLFKLLYLLDFRHFRETGRSVTGLEYRAWKFGPVPVELMEEWEGFKDDLASVVKICPELIIDYMRETVVPVPTAQFDDRHFSKRELRIMAELTDEYCSEYSPKMIDITHANNGAWAKVWDGGKGFDKPIHYELAVGGDDPHRDAILEAAREYEAITAALRE